MNDFNEDHINKMIEKWKNISDKYIELLEEVDQFKDSEDFKNLPEGLKHTMSIFGFFSFPKKVLPSDGESYNIATGLIASSNHASSMMEVFGRQLCNRDKTAFTSFVKDLIFGSIQELGFSGTKNILMEVISSIQEYDPSKNRSSRLTDDDNTPNSF